MGDIGNTFTGLSGKTKDDFGHGQARFVTYMNVFSNPIATMNRTELVEIDYKQNEVRYGDIFFTTSSETPEEVGMSSVWLENKANVYLNSFCFGFRPTEQNNPYYMAYMLRANDFRNKMILLAQGISRYNISKNSAMNIEIQLPKIKEQESIGKIFYEIDNLITLHQRKYIFYNSAFLDWEQRKLGDIGKAISGIGFPDREQGGKIGIPFYKVSDMNNVGNEYEMQTANNYVSLDQVNKNHWNIIDNVPAIIFAKVGAAVMLNRKRLCRFPFLLDNNSMTFIFDKNILNPDFSKYIFERIYLPSLVQVGALPSYNAPQVESINIILPDNSEQRRISDVLSNLDNLITLHQRLKRIEGVDNFGHLRWK